MYRSMVEWFLNEVKNNNMQTPLVWGMREMENFTSIRYPEIYKYEKKGVIRKTKRYCGQLRWLRGEAMQMVRDILAYEDRKARERATRYYDQLKLNEVREFVKLAYRDALEELHREENQSAGALN